MRLMEDYGEPLQRACRLWSDRRLTPQRWSISPEFSYEGVEPRVRAYKFESRGTQLRSRGLHATERDPYRLG